MSRIVSRLNLALIAAIACATIAGFWFLPANQQLALHWNWHGDVDNRGPKELALLVLPTAAFAITLVFWILERFILKLDELHGGRQFALGLSGTLAVFFVLQLAIIRHGLGYPVDVSRAMAFVAALVFIVIGNVLPKMQPTARRLSWPKSLDASRHRRIQRLTGGVMMVSGFGLLIGAVFNLPAPWLNSLTILAALLPAAAGIAYALVLSSARASNG